MEADDELAVKPPNVKPPLPHVMVQPNPDVTCVICLDTVYDRAVLPECLHEYCYSCIATWSTENNVCPLCKRIFARIYHDVISTSNYGEFIVPHIDRPAHERCGEGNGPDFQHFLLTHPIFTRIAAHIPRFQAFINNVGHLLHQRNTEETRRAIAEEWAAEMARSPPELDSPDLPPSPELDPLDSQSPPELDRYDIQQPRALHAFAVQSRSELDSSTSQSLQEMDSSILQSSPMLDSSALDSSPEPPGIPTTVSVNEVPNRPGSSTENDEQPSDNDINNMSGLKNTRKRASAVTHDHFLRSKARRLPSNDEN